MVLNRDDITHFHSFSSQVTATHFISVIILLNILASYPLYKSFVLALTFLFMFMTSLRDIGGGVGSLSPKLDGKSSS